MQQQASKQSKQASKTDKTVVKGVPWHPSVVLPGNCGSCKSDEVHFLVSCASANERSIQIKGDASVQGGVAARPGAEVADLRCFGMLFVKSRGPAARCAVKQIGLGPPAVPGRRPRGRCASRGRSGIKHFGFEVAPVFFGRPDGLRRTGSGIRVSQHSE